MIKAYEYLNEIPKAVASGDYSNILDEYNLAGARLSGKTFAIDESGAVALAITIAKQDRKVAMYGFRALSSDTEELRKDFQQALDEIGLEASDSKLVFRNGHYIYTAKNNVPTWKFPNGSFVQFKGVYKSNSSSIALKGLSSCRNFDLSIEWREEANEIGNKEKQAISFAIRGAKKHITISSTNPDSIYQEHITYLNDRVKFDKKTLIDKGEQLGIIKEEGLTKLFHYTNFRINPFLEDWQLAKFKELAKLDPVKYEIWGIGMPGGLETSIFSRYLKSSMRDFQPIHYYAGLDVGQADSPTGHPTHGVLISLDSNKKRLFVESEYYHSNATMNHKDTFKIAIDIVEFYISQASKHPMITRGLQVNVDYGGGGAVMVDVFKQVMRTMYPDVSWLTFEKVVKDVWLVKDRIDAFIVLLTTQQAKINEQLTPWLYKTMNLMEWKAPSNNKSNYKLEPLDLYDDGFDALCYGIMPIMKTLISQVGNSLFLPKQFIG